RLLNECTNNGADVGVAADAAANPDANVLVFRKDPTISVESVEAKGDKKRKPFAVEPFDILCWIRNVFIRAQHVLIVTPAFSKSRPSGDLTVGAVSSEEKSTAEYSPVAELRMDAGFVFINPDSTDTLIEGRTRCRRGLRKTIVELRPQRQISGRPSFVVRSVTLNGGVVKTNAVEGTIHKVIEFRLEIRKPRQPESVDPTGAWLVSRNDHFLHHVHT